MPRLPRTIPATVAERLAATLAAAGIELGPLKPGARVTHTVNHLGARWELMYAGTMGWFLSGPGVEHGVFLDPEEVAAHISAPPTEQAMRPVHVRIGTHRTTYHPDTACPALNGKPETYRGAEIMPEHQAVSGGLTLCGQCETTLSGPPQKYAGAPVPALVRAAWTDPLGAGWRLGVRSAIAAR